MTLQEQFPARPESLSLIHEWLGKSWPAMAQACASPPDTTWRLQFDTALFEVVTNVIAHGNSTSPDDATVEMTIEVHDDRISAQVRDRGAPFTGDLDASVLLTEPDLNAERGRGLIIAQAALSEIAYARDETGENCWSLMKLFQPTNA